jgi:hypothetical protein
MKDFDDALESALRTREPDVGDAGFSERLLARLPPIEKRRAIPRRWTLAAAAAAGSLATILFAPTVESLIGYSVPYFGTAPVLTIAAILAVAVGSFLWVWRTD